MGLANWIDALKAPGVVVDDQRAGGIVVPPGRTNLTRAEVEALLSKVGAFTAADMERTQPNLRTAVRFLARNVAQLGLHSFVRTQDGGRERDRSSAAAKLIAEPSPAQSEYELIFSVVADLALFDEAWLTLIPVREGSSPSGTGWILRPLPVSGVSILDGSEWTGDLRVEVSLDGKRRVIEWDRLIHLQGWNPAYGTSGTPPLDALKGTLMEQIAAQAYRLGVWKNGGQVSAFITRPATAAPWGQEARKRFVEGMKEYKAGGRERGGLPVLEDGMEIKTNRLTAKEEQFIEAAKLSLETVARVYFINPAMLGESGGITYANMREFRKSLYGETLGPILEQVEQKLNARLLPLVGVDRTKHYLEFNLKAKLAGDFETEGKILQTAVGGAYMSPNEARARQNLPAIPGGDQVLRPLNMDVWGAGDEEDAAKAAGITPAELAALINGAATLIRSGFLPDASLAAVGLDPIAHMGLLPVTVQRPQNADGTEDEELEAELEEGAKALRAALLESRSHGGPRRLAFAVRSLESIREKRVVSVREVRTGSTALAVSRETSSTKSATPRAGERTEDLIRGVITKHAERQRVVVLAKIRSKAGTPWWDAARWDRELKADLQGAALAVVGQIGTQVAADLGFSGAFDLRTAAKFLEAVAESRAGMINATTRDQLQKALESDEDGALEKVFAKLETSRGEEASTTLHSTLAAFAGVEAAKHVARTAGGDEPRKAWKTWQVRSGNPRASHSKMNGQKVLVDEPFSNGANWPGDPVLGADGVAGCQCGVEVTVE